MTVSDGTMFQVQTSYDGVGASYQATYPDRRVHLTTDGDSARSHSSNESADLPDGFALWILSHQFHAQITQFAHINEGISETRRCPESVATCEELFGNKTGMDIGIDRLSLKRDIVSMRPLELVVHRADNDPVVATFGDWRALKGGVAPFTIHIDDGERKFIYRFRELQFDKVAQ